METNQIMRNKDLIRDGLKKVLAQINQVCKGFPLKYFLKVFQWKPLKISHKIFPQSL